jgi:hypothetical protein
VKKSDLLDHRVGASDERWRHVEAERLGSPEVDNQLVLGRCLHWKVAGLLAFEDAIDISGRASVRIDGIKAISQQAAGVDEKVLEIDCGQFVPCRQRDDQIAMNDCQAACRHDQTAIPLARKRRDAALDLIGVPQVDRAQLYPERWRSGLDYGELADSLGYARIPKDCRACYARCDLFEQLQPFRAEAVLVSGKSGGVAPRGASTFDSGACPLVQLLFLAR